MEKLATWVIQAAVTLMIFVAVVSIGYLIYLAVTGIPGTSSGEDCAPATPALPVDDIDPGRSLLVRADPADCALNLPPDATYDVHLSVTNAMVDQEADFAIPVNPDGSFQSLISLDPRNAWGEITVTVTATAYDSMRPCADTASCVATTWVLQVVVD